MTDQGPRRIPRHAFKDSYYPGSGLNYENRNKCGVLGCGLGYEAPVHWILDEVVTPLGETEDEKLKLTVEVVESTFTENESAPWPGPKPSTFSMPDLGPNTSIGHGGRDKGWRPMGREPRVVGPLESGPETGALNVSYAPERETPRPKISREARAYGQTIEGVLNNLPPAEAKRVVNIARDALFFGMSIPSVIANVLATSPALRPIDLNIDPAKWDTAYDIWFKLASQNR